MSMHKNELTDEEKRVIIDKGTEARFAGEYVNNKANVLNHCKKEVIYLSINMYKLNDLYFQ
jgi:peptide methionine sulfoxide reductase MsrB